MEYADESGFSSGPSSDETRPAMNRLLSLSYHPIAVLSCLFFVFVYNVVSPRLSYSLVPGYRALSRKEQIDWNTRMVSNVHAVIVSALCVHELLFDEGIRANPVWCEGCLVRFNCAVVSGYLLADLVIILLNWNFIGEVFFVTHHCVVIYGYFYVMSYGVLPWFANFRLLAEISTPFVNQRWFLDVLGLKKTKGYVINGFILFTTFFCVRILTMPLYYYRLYSIYDVPFFTTSSDSQDSPLLTDPEDIGLIRHTAVLCCLLLDAINVYWFSKIFRGARKLYLTSKRASGDAKRSDQPADPPTTTTPSNGDAPNSETRRRIAVGAKE